MHLLKITSLFFLAFFFAGTLAQSPIVLAKELYIAQQSPLPKPLAPQVKNYLETGKSTPVSELKGTGDNVQLLYEGPKRISDLLFGFMSLIAIAISLQAGIHVLFSKGDAKKFKEGIMSIIYAVVGMVLIGSAWIIVRLILQINLGN